PPFPPAKIEEVGPTTFTRPPSPTRHTSIHEDISKGGGDFVSLPESNETPQTPAATAAGGAEDSTLLTALSFKLDRCIHSVITLENELGVTKKVLGGAVLKLVTRVKRLEGLLQQRKRRLVLSDSEGEDTTPTEEDIDLEALHTLARTSLGGDSYDTRAGHDAAEVPADTSMPFRSLSTTRRRLKKPFSSSSLAHVPENVPAGAGISAAATTIPAGRPMDAAVHAVDAPPSSIPTAADKGKALMVDVSLPADLLSEQERILKNLNDSQLGEELVKKLHADQEAEFTRQQEELAQKLIYTEADWVDLLAKIAINSALSKQLLGDDVTEENMHERLVYNQGWTMKKVKVPADVPAAPSFAADVSVSAATTPVVPAAESHLADTLTASAHTDLQKLLGVVDNLYQWEDPDTFALLLWVDLHVLFQSLDDEDAHDFWRNQDSWHIRSWRLYPSAQ
nr:hypothetical protein [Tanacetum cinerariifolium]